MLGNQPLPLKGGTLPEQLAGGRGAVVAACRLLLAQNDELLATNVCFSVKRTSRRPVTASGFGTNPINADVLRTSAVEG
jgi:hypothetical protein